VAAQAGGDARASEGVCDCREDCAEAADPSAALSFDHREHRLWYQARFWRGECASGLSWCFPGKGWYETMAVLLARTPNAEQDGLCARLFDLGRRVGHEWAKDNDIRNIDTDDLGRWQAQLLNPAADPRDAVDAIEALADSRLP